MSKMEHFIQENGNIYLYNNERFGVTQFLLRILSLFLSKIKIQALVSLTQAIKKSKDYLKTL